MSFLACPAANSIAGIASTRVTLGSGIRDHHEGSAERIRSSRVPAASAQAWPRHFDHLGEFLRSRLRLPWPQIKTPSRSTGRSGKGACHCSSDLTLSVATEWIRPWPLFNPRAMPVSWESSPTWRSPDSAEVLVGPDPLRVASGGTTSRAAYRWLLVPGPEAPGLRGDLERSGCTVRIGAGCRMRCADLPGAAWAHDCRWVVLTPRSGYVLTGGMRPLSRSF